MEMNESVRKYLTARRQIEGLSLIEFAAKIDVSRTTLAVGSALPWGGRGRGFKSRHSDQIKSSHRRWELFIYVKLKGTCKGAGVNDASVGRKSRD